MSFVTLMVLFVLVGLCARANLLLHFERLKFEKIEKLILEADKAGAQAVDLVPLLRALDHYHRRL